MKAYTYRSISDYDWKSFLAENNEAAIKRIKEKHPEEHIESFDIRVFPLAMAFAEDKEE